jgi:hypothetical protein
MNILILNETLNIIVNMINSYSDYIIEISILSLGIIILSTSIGKTVLEHGHKVLTATAANISIYNSYKSSGNSGSDDSEDKNKDKKDESKEVKDESKGSDK